MLERLIRWSAAGAALALPAVVGARLAGWWPCDVACQGGGMYQRLFGFEVLWGALVGYLALAGLAVQAALRPADDRRLLQALSGLLSGVSLFYLLVSAALELTCPFCLTVHGLVAMVGLLVQARLWPWLVVGALATNAAYHHGPLRDVAAAPAVQPATISSPLAATIEANRRRGVSDAPLRLEVVLDLQCPHCAQSWSGLATAIVPAIQAGRLNLTLRLVERRAEPASRDLARWAFAAAAHGPAAHGRYIISLLGVRSGLTTDEIRRGYADDLAGLDATLAEHGALIEGLVDADQAAIAKLGLRGATPLVVLSGRDGRARGRWSGAFDPVEIGAAIAATDAP
jgi:protein-disulfide isomerase